MRDLRTGEVMVPHYRCPACRHRFRHYPEGVERALEPAHGGSTCPVVGHGPFCIPPPIPWSQKSPTVHATVTLAIASCWPSNPGWDAIQELVSRLPEVG